LNISNHSLNIIYTSFYPNSLSLYPDTNLKSYPHDEHIYVSAHMNKHRITALEMFAPFSLSNSVNTILFMT
jgi:hypothetical protein